MKQGFIWAKFFEGDRKKSWTNGSPWGGCRRGGVPIPAQSAESLNILSEFTKSHLSNTSGDL